MKPDYIDDKAKEGLKGILTYLMLVVHSRNHRIFCTFASGDKNFEKMALDPLEQIQQCQLGEKAKEQLREMLGYLKSLAGLEHASFHSQLLNDEFEKKIIAPMKKLSEWNKKDDSIVYELYQNLASEIDQGQDSKKSDKLWEIIKAGAKIASGGAVIWGIYKAVAKKK